jgi:iron complex outermembrane receptor protein
MKVHAAKNLLLAAAAGIAYCNPALAQDAGPTQQEEAEATGDILVTAQRTASLLSKTPVAVTAIDGEELQRRNVANPTDLGDLAPNLSVVRNNGLQITIRGVTSNDNTEKGDPSAAFLLDGVYIARPQAQEVSFYDVDRVEVLRGPQGTLYGRNTTAGVINVITNKPKDYFEAAGNFTYGNYDTVRADAMVNLPAGEAVAFRLAGAVEKRDSYLAQVPGDTNEIDPFKENYSVRGQALFQLGAAADLLIRADYSDLSGSGMSAVRGTKWYAPVPAGAPSYTNPEYIGDQFSSRELREIGYDLAVTPETDGSTWGVDGELNWDLGLFAMTYLGSYREFENEGVAAPIFFFGPSVTTFGGAYDQLSQELRFALNSVDALDLQFGAYYFEENSTNNLVLPGIVGFEQGPTKAESYAFFGQGTLHATDDLRLTAGGRWSHDDKERVGRTFNPVTNALISPNDAAVTSSKFTWRLGLDYDLSPEALLYAVVSTGYKAGGFNGGCEAGTPNCTNPRPNEALYYDPETLTAYEVGLKTRALNNMLRLTATVT